MAVLQTITYHIHNFRDALLEDRKGWIICACVLIITVVRSGITYSFGVFVVELESLYHAPMAEQNWIGTLSFCISLMCAPLTVALIRCMGHRGYRLGGMIGTLVLSVSCLSSSIVRSLEWLFLTHSILYGVGSSLIYMASSLVIGEYFDKDHKYHVLATSILLCGYPIGSLVFNPVNAWLVSSFGWRLAFRVTSGLIFFSGMACCWTFSARDSPNMQRLVEEGEDIDSDMKPPAEALAEVAQELRDVPRRCCTLAELKARPEIALWYLGNCLSYLGFYMPFLNLAMYMELKGIPTSKSSWAITLLSFAECITYMVASFLGDKLKGRLVNVNIVAAAALALVCLFWPSMDVSYSVILLISIIMGGFLGLTIVYTYAASGEVTQLPIDIAWSFTNLWSGMGILVGPFFSGAIYDYRKSYDDVFYVVGALYVIDAIIFASIPLMDRYRQRTAGKLDYADIPGATVNAQPGQQTQTFRITTSISKSSLANGDAGDAGPPVVTAAEAAATLSSGERTKTGPPQRPPKPNLTRRPTEESPLNPFRESTQPTYNQNQYPAGYSSGGARAGGGGGSGVGGGGGGGSYRGDPLTGYGSSKPEEMQMRSRDEFKSYNRFEN